MKSASIHEIKEELSALQPKKVQELCLRLAKFKKENKELLSYLLFESHNEHGYVESIKQEMGEQFAQLPSNNWYAAKKNLRKILRGINKYSKQTSTKESEVEMLLHFSTLLKNSGLPISRHKALSSLQDAQFKKLERLIKDVHEDLNFDYKKQLAHLQEQDEESASFLNRMVKMIRR